MSSEAEGYGQLGGELGSPRLEFERRLAQRPDEVWRAISEPAFLDQWFPAHVDMEFRVGGRMTFAFLTNDIVPPPGRVMAIEVGRLFEFEWGGEALRFEVEGVDGGSVLRFGYSFADVGEAAKAAAGWHVYLDALEAVLRDEVPAPPRDAWGRLFGEYREMFG